MSLAATTYGLPETALYALRHKEGGTVGMVSKNRNGTVDYGPFQVNSLWVKTFTAAWDTGSDALTVSLLRDSDCANTFAAAWILRQHLTETRSLTKAIAHYHSRTPTRGQPYRDDVLSIMSKIEAPR